MERIKEEKEKVRISKICFLIHPGYSTDPRNWKHYSQESRSEGIKKYAFLSEKYLEQARNFHDDELMFAFAHKKSADIKLDAKNEFDYVSLLRDLRRILGRRLIILSDEIDVLNNADAFKIAKHIANCRGFDFDRQVFSEAFGETLVHCVSRGADKLNKGGRLDKKTDINSELTEADIENYGPETFQWLKDQHRRVNYP